MLSQEENRRYNRHLILDQIGRVGQEKIKSSKVLVIGAGGLGCPVLQYLTAAGVGTIGIIDDDIVDISNLQRQILFTTNDIGKSKAEVAAQRLSQLNNFVDFVIYNERLTTKNAIAIFQEFDIIIDGTDNFSTRYLVNDACILTNKPLVFGSIYTFEGQISVFNYDGGPSYRCLFPTPPKAGTTKNCSEIGVLGVLPGIIGTQQANEALKLVLGIGEPLSGKLLIYDSLKATYTTLLFSKSKNEVEKVLMNRKEFESFDYELFCGIERLNKNPDLISGNQLKLLLGEESIRIIDLREDWEEPELIGTNVERITMSEIRIKESRFFTPKTVILVCQTGTRSSQVKTLFSSNPNANIILELKGGMDNYER